MMTKILILLSVDTRSSSQRLKEEFWYDLLNEQYTKFSSQNVVLYNEFVHYTLDLT